MTTLPVGIIQARPVYYDLAATMDKTASLIDEAAKQGLRLVSLGETWLPGYPAWLDYCPDASRWNHPPVKQVFARLRQNSVVVGGKETERLSKLASAHKIVIVIGVNERVDRGPGNGTLYNTLLTFNANGALVNHHRKLVPTYTERMVWGQGDGHGLQAVDTAAGRVSALVCWEHWMPLTRQTLHESFEQIHVAAWPTVHEMHQVASRQYAFEARCFVLACGSILKAADLPSELTPPPELVDEPDHLAMNGGSAIIAPDGRYLAGPVYRDETIVAAEIDLSEIDQEKMTLDTTGHYARPDVFNLTVNRDRRGG